MRINHLKVIVALAMALTIAAMTVYASLVPTTFGFPVIVQNGSTSAFNQDNAMALDVEDLNISWPIFADGFAIGPFSGGAGGVVDGIAGGGGFQANELPFGPVNLSFPDINQHNVQLQIVNHTDFAQTNEFAEFAYPFVGVGPVALPGFGFGW